MRVELVTMWGLKNRLRPTDLDQTPHFTRSPSEFVTESGLEPKSPGAEFSVSSSTKCNPQGQRQSLRTSSSLLCCGADGEEKPGGWGLLEADHG